MLLLTSQSDTPDQEILSQMDDLVSEEAKNHDPLVTILYINFLCV